MRKIPTLFKRDPDDMAHVLPEVTPGCEWVLEGEGVATRMYDGTCVMLDSAGWWARREVKPGKERPNFFREEETDETTGKTVGWEPIDQSPFKKFLDEALVTHHEHGTYELCGPRINGNPEGFEKHVLVPHGRFAVNYSEDSNTYEGLRSVLLTLKMIGQEGIVWHHPDGRMAKLKGKDFA